MQVDCSTVKRLCLEQEVVDYPTIHAFHNGAKVSVHDVLAALHLSNNGAKVSVHDVLAALHLSNNGAKVSVHDVLAALHLSQYCCACFGIICCCWRNELV